MHIIQELDRQISKVVSDLLSASLKARQLVSNFWSLGNPDFSTLGFEEHDEIIRPNDIIVIKLFIVLPLTSRAFCCADILC